MTERLYYTDCYLSHFRANVIETSPDLCRAYLDRTAFYPTSGGQPHDLGVLNGVAVVDVVDEEDRIAHVLAQPLTSIRAEVTGERDEVTGEIDWTRRYDHMQQHTGQHLLSAVWVELFGIGTLSFHMGNAVSTIELDVKELTEEQISSVERRSNEICWQAHPVHLLVQDVVSAEGLRKPAARLGPVRIVSIEQVDRSACGGTHLRSTAEAAPIQIRSAEKIRGHVRIEFICGGRTLLQSKSDYHTLVEAARQAGVTVGDLAHAVSRLRSRLTESEKDRTRLGLEAAQREGAALHGLTPPGPDGMRRVRLVVRTIDELVRAKVQTFTGQGAALALVVGEEPAGVLVACAPGSGFDAGKVIKSVLPRGGGSSTIAQGNLPEQAMAERIAAALGFEVVSHR